MDVYHQSHSEYWCGEIDNRDRHEGGNQDAGEKYRAVVGLAQSFGLRDWLMTHRGQLEIFAAEEIGAGQKKNDDARACENQKWYGNQIDHDREQSRVH